MRERTPIKDLLLQGSPNLRRALDREPLRPLAKRAELEQLFADLIARREEALADVRKNGLVLVQDKFSARGELYQIRVVNPALAIARQAELQIVDLAKLIGAEAEDLTAEDAELSRDLDEIFGPRQKNVTS